MEKYAPQVSKIREFLGITGVKSYKKEVTKSTIYKNNGFVKISDLFSVDSLYTSKSKWCCGGKNVVR